jgi:hypothetical protein
LLLVKLAACRTCSCVVLNVYNSAVILLLLL